MRSGGRPAPAAELPFWAWAVLAVFCLALLTVSVPVTVAVYDLGLAPALLLATVGCGSLVVAVVRPVLGATLQLGAVAATALAVGGSPADPWPLPITGLVALLALVLLLGIREPWPVSVAVWWASVVVLVAVIVLSPERYAVPDRWGTDLTVYAGAGALVLVVSIALGQRRRIRADLAQARRDVALEKAQRRYVEERARIARELHDVVAHSMSLVYMQAFSAPHRLAGAPQTAIDEEFGDIARSARSALAEMRQLLGVLRAEDADGADGADGAELVPQPQLGDIPALAEATTRAGVPVRVEVVTQAGTAGPLVQLTAYRVAQEALSNVVRHAPGAVTVVDVRRDGDDLRVSVRNEPPDPDAVAGAASPDEGGLGLSGMRERVALLGGHLAARPLAGGGYVVEATIPAVADRRTEQR